MVVSAHPQGRHGESAQPDRGLDVPGRYGDYWLQERLGVGGMAEVYRGRLAGGDDESPSVVIKRLKPRYASVGSALRLFSEEARLSASVRHPNIVQVHDLVELPAGEVFITMEHVDGPDLRWLLNMARRRRRRLPAWLSVFLITEILEALHFLSELRDRSDARRNIVHCDVTPENVFISSTGEVKLGDFGVAVEDARPEDHHLGQLRGKLPYCSPEQALGNRLDARSDVYSAAAVLWECLTGRPLVSTRRPEEARRIILSDQRPRPSRHNANVPPLLDDVILAALAPDRARRTPGAKVFRDRLLKLQPHLHGPISRQDVVDAMTEVLAPPTPGSASEPDIEILDPAPLERQDTADRLLAAPSPIAVPHTPRLLPQEGLLFPTWVHSTEGALGPMRLSEAFDRLEGRADRDLEAWGVSVTGTNPVSARRAVDLLGFGLERLAVRDVPVAWSRRLGPSGLAAISSHVARSRSTGILTVVHPSRRGRDRRQLIVAQGRLVDARSTLSALRTWSILTHPQREDADLFAAAAHRVIAQGCSVYEVLTPQMQDVLHDVRRFEVQRLVEECFHWDSGSAEFAPVDVAPVPEAPFLAHLVPQTVLQTFDESRLETLLRPHLARRVVPTAAFDLDVEEYGLLDAERWAVEVLLGAASLGEGLDQVPPEGRGLAMAMAFGLEAVGLLIFT